MSKQFTNRTASAAIVAGVLILAGCGNSGYEAESLTTATPGAPTEESKTMHQFTLKDIDGNEKSLADFKGKAVLVVNVASECGFTPQYTGLEALWQSYKDKGLVVLGVPSNDFGAQEPGSDTEIKAFCTTNYNATFPMLTKMPVKNGETQCALYQFLTDKSKNGALDAEIKWNFNKVLVGKDGTPIKHYESKVKPQDEELAKDIEAALS